jgi:hypothetical protein
MPGVWLSHQIDDNTWNLPTGKRSNEERTDNQAGTNIFHGEINRYKSSISNLIKQKIMNVSCKMHLTL